MDIIESIGIGATTVVVDIDRMTDEIKRLRAKQPDNESNDAEAEGQARVPDNTQSSIHTGPVNDPSWNGKLDVEHVREPDRELKRFQCGR